MVRYVPMPDSPAPSTVTADPVVRLLLVEDDPADAELFKLHIEVFDHPAEIVAVATTLADALEMIDELGDGVDIVVADLGLPDASGFEVVEALVERAPDTPILVLTGRNADGSPALDAGAQDYLVKQHLRGEQLERALRYAISRQATISALRSTTRDVEHLVYSVTHDLKGPLTVATGFLEMLRDSFGDELNEDRATMFDAIERSNKRMTTIISDLLEYARAVHGALNLSATDLGELVRSVANSRTPGETAAIDVGDLPTIHADPRLLRHVFENLVGNALKYADPERPIEVTVRAHRHAIGWQIDVDDNGRGIPEKSRERVFDIFVRSPEVEEVSGTGIGLSICRRAVERHGGRIWVDDTGGPGTRISLALPQSALSFDAAASPK